jgi:hypothetical protein
MASGERKERGSYAREAGEGVLMQRSTPLKFTSILSLPEPSVPRPTSLASTTTLSRASWPHSGSPRNPVDSDTKGIRGSCAWRTPPSVSERERGGGGGSKKRHSIEVTETETYKR